MATLTDFLDSDGNLIATAFGRTFIFEKDILNPTVFTLRRGNGVDQLVIRYDHLMTRSPYCCMAVIQNNVLARAYGVNPSIAYAAAYKELVEGFDWICFGSK